MATPAPVSTIVRTVNVSAFAVLAYESQAEFDRSLAALVAEHRPVTQHQKFLVHQLAVQQWLIQRAQRLESRAFDHLAGALLDPADPESRIVSRMYETNPKSLDVIQRYAAQAEKSYYRAFRELTNSKNAQNEPKSAQPPQPKQNEPKRNSPAPAFNPALANPYKTKPTLRSQYPDNLALCL